MDDSARHPARLGALGLLVGFAVPALGIAPRSVSSCLHLRRWGVRTREYATRTSTGPSRSSRSPWPPWRRSPSSRISSFGLRPGLGSPVRPRPHRLHIHDRVLALSDVPSSSRSAPANALNSTAQQLFTQGLAVALATVAMRVGHLLGHANVARAQYTVAFLAVRGAIINGLWSPWAVASVATALVLRPRPSAGEVLTTQV